MGSLLVLVFATFLALSQVLVQPQDLRTTFDPTEDRAEVVNLLRKGCAHMRQAFEIEHLNLDDLVAVAMDDPEAHSAKFRGLSFADMHAAYKAVCTHEGGTLPVEPEAVIKLYNHALFTLPDHTRLIDLKLLATTTVLDRNGQKFAEITVPENRRVPVRLSAISPNLQAAFIAAEDRRFLQHKGIDERAIIRAFVVNLAGGDMQGGSTITQQLAKNLLVGSENSYIRKIREVVVASRAESVLSKDAILELYLNAIFLGRGAWGAQMAAQRYFGKDASALSVAEAALLAGQAKGPTYYNPDRYPQRARERTVYVLGRMRDDGFISSEQHEEALAENVQLIPRPTSRRTSGYYVLDHIRRETERVAGLRLLSDDAYVIRSTIDSRIQKAAESALQEGLFSYERSAGRASFEGPEMNLSERINAPATANGGNEPRWQHAIRTARLPLYDVHWPAAVVLDEADLKPGSKGHWVGLGDGRIVPLQAPRSDLEKLEPYDVVHVRLKEAKKGSVTAELRVRPKVQGAVVVLENATGRILAMTGGFSYPLSQFNRATQSFRQPGSAIKPLTYLAALGKGLQPTTLVRDSPLTLPPIGDRRNAKRENYWSPGNYDGRSRGTMTLRSALENSRNLPTVHLLAEGIAPTAEAALDEVCDLAREVKVYSDCVRFYPLVLGAQPVRPLDLARFYAAVASEGLLPEPHVIESVSDPVREHFHHSRPPTRIGSADAAAFYQLKSILQGAVLRGTAARMKSWAPYIAGKTGTTNGAVDAWFVGFSNEVTVAVWVGYDNARMTQSLGKGRTGGNVAIPIFEPIMEAIWRDYAPRTVLAPPQDAATKLTTASGAKPNSRTSSKKPFAIVEYLRTNAKGKVIDKRHALVSRQSSQPSQQRQRPPERAEDHYASGHRYQHYQHYAADGPWGWFRDDRGWRGPGAPERPPTSGYAPRYAPGYHDRSGAQSRW
jgi:penicillin-binding protein 1A